MKHYMTADRAAALDLETNMRLYPHGRVWWTNVRFARDHQGVVILRRLVESPTGRWGLVTREMRVDPDALLEVDANEEAEAIIQGFIREFVLPHQKFARARLGIHSITVWPERE